MPREIAEHGSIQTGTDFDFERRWRIAQRIAWGVLALLVAGGLAGLFGRGPLSKASAGREGDPLRVEYERLARYKTPADMKVSFGPAAMRNRMTTLLVSKEIAETLKLNQTVPAPVATATTRDGLLLMFQLEPAQDAVRLAQEPSRWGRVTGRIAVPGASHLDVSQFIYP